LNDSSRRRRALVIHYMTSEALFTGRDHAQSLRGVPGALRMTARPFDRGVR